jgi:NADP-dependent 3-hydroxy acid dehydrogenase YdfG
MPKDQIVVVSGLGNCTGTGGETARLFGKEGFRVALLSRPRPEVDQLKQEINKNGGMVSL